jgi:membrane dipeptidase
MRPGVLTTLRTPEPGLLYTQHLDRLAWMNEMVANHDLRRRAFRGRSQGGAWSRATRDVADVEGLDFLEGKLERLEEAHQRGVRHVQLVHYTPND